MRQTGRWFAALAAVAALALTGLAGEKTTEKPEAPIKSDGSLTLKEYAKLGMPSPGKAWAGRDYIRACRALVDLAKRRPDLLPRWRSDKSGKLFARMVSVENLKPAENAKAALNPRLQLAGTCMVAFGSTLITYGKANTETGLYGDEIIEMIGFGLRVAALTMELLGELPRDALRGGAAAARNEKVVKQTIEGLSEVVDGAIAACGDGRTYTLDARLRLAGYLKEALPRLLPRLPEEKREGIRARVDGLLKEVKDPKLRAMAEALRALAKPPEETPELDKGKE